MNSIFNYMRNNPVKSGLIGIGTTAALGLVGYKLYQSRYQQLEGPHWDRSVSGEKFHASITAAKTHNIVNEGLNKAYLTKNSKQHGAFVHAYPAAEYSKMKIFLLNDGSEKGVAGLAVKDGDIVSVFKHPSCKVRGVVDKFLIPKALENGGNRLDCFNGFLPKLYARNGFEPVSKTSFNRDFAPEDWNYDRDGEPDVIFMKHSTRTPPEELVRDVESSIERLPASGSYKEAQAIQQGS